MFDESIQDPSVKEYYESCFMSILSLVYVRLRNQKTFMGVARAYIYVTSDVLHYLSLIGLYALLSLINLKWVFRALIKYLKKNDFNRLLVSDLSTSHLGFTTNSGGSVLKGLMVNTEFIESLLLVLLVLQHTGFLLKLPSYILSTSIVVILLGQLPLKSPKKGKSEVWPLQKKSSDGLPITDPSSSRGISNTGNGGNNGSGVGQGVNGASTSGKGGEAASTGSGQGGGDDNGEDPNRGRGRHRADIADGLDLRELIQFINLFFNTAINYLNLMTALASLSGVGLARLFNTDNVLATLLVVFATLVAMLFVLTLNFGRR